MDSEFAKKLRDEIQSGQSRRHEFCIKKLAFSSGLLGLGSLSIPFGDQQIDLSSLLWLVPIVALAFDFYIVAEDYGVKRAGKFLGKPESGSSEPEQLWESEFVHAHNNPFASIAFFIVSVVLWAGAVIVIWQLNVNHTLVIVWSIAVLVLEFGLLGYSLMLRYWLKQSSQRRQ